MHSGHDLEGRTPELVVCADRRDRTDQKRSRAHRLLLFLLVSGIGLALLMNGSVAAPYRQISFLTLALPLLLTTFVRIDRPATRRALFWWLTCIVITIGWGLIQVSPLPFGWLSHPIWEELEVLGIDAGRRISVSPIETVSALPSLFLPFAVFAAMLILCQQREDALLAWKALVAIGLTLVVLSVVLEVFLPEVFFFSSFPVGRGAFNGIFVNRNVTASFLGLVSFATAAQLMVASVGSESRNREEGSLLDLNWISARGFALGTALFLLVVILFTTRSRAGATFGLALLTLGFATCYVLRSNRSRRSGAGGFTARQKAVIALCLGFGVFLFFGEPVLSRLATVEEDGRWCAWTATWQSIQERPFTGSGFATFADIFPRYRDPECLGTNSTWLRAHNSYLEFVAGMGLFGVISLAFGFAGLLRILVSGMVRRRTLRAIPVFTTAALGFVALHSAFDFPLQIPGVALYFAALMGVGCAVSLLDTNRRRRLPVGRHR